MDAGGDASERVLTALDYGIVEKAVAVEESRSLRDEVDSEIQALVGMDAGKMILETLRKRAAYVESGGSKKVLQVCLNMVITGK